MTNVEEAVIIMENVLAMIPELPEVAEEFGASVEEKVIDISKYVDERNHVTPAQLSALRNMQTGVERWLER